MDGFIFLAWSTGYVQNLRYHRAIVNTELSSSFTNISSDAQWISRDQRDTANPIPSFGYCTRAVHGKPVL